VGRFNSAPKDTLHYKAMAVPHFEPREALYFDLTVKV
jgi:hypothetical protein